jgi:ElaB/YqjD/DUF883 family membrane-anchored ribosome-binding protein
MSSFLDPGKLADDLHSLIGDAEALLRATADGFGEQATEARQRAEESLHALRERLSSLQRELQGRARDVEAYVHHNPWKAIAIVGGIALIVGLLMGRKS